jgi:hypothetical protein
MLPSLGIALDLRVAHDPGMDLRAEVRIDAPPDAAWAVLGDQFGRVGEWAGPIIESSIDGPPGVGAVRTCRITGFGPLGPGVIAERLTVFDPAGRCLEYEAAAGMPALVARASSRWSVHPGDGRACIVRVRARVALRPWAWPLAPALRWPMRGESRRVLEELACRVETGRPHPRKAAALPRPGSRA